MSFLKLFKRRSKEEKMVPKVSEPTSHGDIAQGVVDEAKPSTSGTVPAPWISLPSAPAEFEVRPAPSPSASTTSSASSSAAVGVSPSSVGVSSASVGVFVLQTCMLVAAAVSSTSLNTGDACIDWLVADIPSAAAEIAAAIPQATESTVTSLASSTADIAAAIPELAETAVTTAVSSATDIAAAIPQVVAVAETTATTLVDTAKASVVNLAETVTETVTDHTTTPRRRNLLTRIGCWIRRTTRRLSCFRGEPNEPNDIDTTQDADDTTTTADDTNTNTDTSRAADTAATNTNDNDTATPAEADTPSDTTNAAAAATVAVDNTATEGITTTTEKLTPPETAVNLGADIAVATMKKTVVFADTEENIKKNNEGVDGQNVEAIKPTQALFADLDVPYIDDSDQSE